MRRTALIALAIVATAGWSCDRSGAASTSALGGTEMPAAGGAADFELTDTNGRPYRFLEETRGSVAMLFFGFTNCPDVCPVHMANLAAVLADLPTSISNKVTVVFVTVDPERDTPERLREWLDQFDRDFVGLIGEVDEVREIQLGLGMPPAVIREDPREGSEVGHSAQVMVFSIDRGRRWAYPFGTRQGDWMRDIPLLVGM